MKSKEMRAILREEDELSGEKGRVAKTLQGRYGQNSPTQRREA